MLLLVDTKPLRSVHNESKARATIANIVLEHIYSIAVSIGRCVGQWMQKGCIKVVLLGSVDYQIEY